MLNRRWLILVTFLLVPWQGALAQAVDGSGWYLGASFSGSQLDLQLGTEPKRSENVGGFAFTGGYNLNRSFGLEFELFATAEFSDGRPELVAASYSSFALAPRLNYVLSDQLGLFARFSLISALYEEEYSNAIPLVRGFQRTWSGGGVGLGFGVGYSPSRNLDLRFGLDFNAVTLKSDNLDLFTYIPDTEIREQRSTLAIIYRF